MWRGYSKNCHNEAASCYPQVGLTPLGLALACGIYGIQRDARVGGPEKGRTTNASGAHSSGRG